MLILKQLFLIENRNYIKLKMEIPDIMDILLTNRIIVIYYIIF